MLKESTLTLKMPYIQTFVKLVIMTETPQIRPATVADMHQVASLLPQLTDFDVPAERNPDDLWQGDAALAEQSLRGEAAQTLLEAASSDNNIVGVIMITLREELMSHAPSAHLEAIVVHPSARGTGLGQKLLARSEVIARENGAQSLSLHVFANNQRARALYQSNGFDEELIRAIKWFK